ncbi:hypothetical protein DEJ50_33020 [Streptomyces venezuelae]|uniref:Uncharacterized protein n=1 Tax=Streptomyces venezuelae TaxID=54571 RepID=A0A5P2DB23_STRVZ|nr:hypothetical protein [Streptomyces venezuelae]QES51943.1 hypothetical protein DEJ50_33020 [Streptomyces venezuelae]
MSPTRRPAPTTHTPRNLALGYLALMAAAGLARGIAGASGDGYLAVLYFLSFPGSLLVTVFAILPLNALLGTSAPETANSFGPMVYLVGGAAVNVLLVWGAAKAVRRLRG